MPLSYSDPRPVPRNEPTMHGNHRQIQLSVVSRRLSETAGDKPPMAEQNDRWISIVWHRTRTPRRSLRRTDRIRIITHNVSEPSPPGLGAFPPCSRTPKTLPVRHQPDSGISDRFSVAGCQKTDNAPSNRADYTRPETHQNLIHTDKEQVRQPADNVGDLFPEEMTATIS